MKNLKRYQEYRTLRQFKNAIKDTGLWLELLVNSPELKLFSLTDNKGRLIQVARVLDGEGLK